MQCALIINRAILSAGVDADLVIVMIIVLGVNVLKPPALRIKVVLQINILKMVIPKVFKSKCYNESNV